VRVIDPLQGLSADVEAASLDDDLCLCDASTIAQHPAWAAAFAEGRRCVTFLDEAHLLTSAGVRQWLAELKRPLPIRLLGATSRPPEALDAEPHLWRDTFCGALGLRADGAQARALGWLLPCAPRLLRTGVAPEAFATPEDAASFAQTQAPSPHWLARLAAVPQRDAPLLDALLEAARAPQPPFRKALVLTLGTGHTLRLLNGLREQGEEAAHLLPTNPDSNPLLRAPALRRFADLDGGPRLLLAPFNTAPSALHAAARTADALVIAYAAPSAEALRALLGVMLSPDKPWPCASAQLWVLADQWSDAAPAHQQPLLPLLDMLCEPPQGDDLTGEVGDLERAASALLPWDVALSIRRAIDAQGLPLDHSGLPLGWWALLGGGERVCVPIYPQHRDAWASLHAHLARLIRGRGSTRDASALRAPGLAESLWAVFDDLPTPRPPLSEVKALVAHVERCGGERPLFAPFPTLDDITPARLAATLWAQDAPLRAVAAHVQARHQDHPLAALLYPTARDLRRAVLAALDLLAEPLPLEPPATPARWDAPLPHPHPPHDLDRLCAAVMDRARALQDTPRPLPALSARWTHAPLHGWQARALPPADPTDPTPPIVILVNRALNTPTTSTDALAALLWRHYQRALASS
jgi:hypothetical protein